MHLVGPTLAITSGCFCLPFAVLLETLNYEITQDSSFSLAFLDRLCPRPFLFWTASGPWDVAHEGLHKPHTLVSYLAVIPLQILHGMMQL